CFQAEDGIRGDLVTGVQTCALPICIVAQGKTALGGDNRTGVGCLVTMIATLLERKLPHGPLTVLFTVREESGLWGARFVETEGQIGRASCRESVEISEVGLTSGEAE